MRQDTQGCSKDCLTDSLMVVNRLRAGVSSPYKQKEKEVLEMAVFKCEKCGATKEGRCKPKKCPSCGETGTMKKES